jgi:protein-disulfide isomerase
MEENNIENKGKNNQQQIAGAILIAGVLIAGAVLLKGNTPSGTVPITALAPISADDSTIGNPKAKVALILYEDFQCPFCGAVSGLAPESEAVKYLKQIDPTWSPFMTGVNEYVQDESVKFVYRDWAFLGPESVKSAEAARCSGDQGKFWEYHDYLYSHQNGENKGNFSDPNLKTFAKYLGLNSTAFDQCLDSGKYTKAVTDSKDEGVKAGVTGTPKGFILKNGKIVATIDGAESWTTVKPKLDNALK